MGFRVKINDKELKLLQKDLQKAVKVSVDRNTAKRAGRSVVRDMKSKIAKGNSPIKGTSPFPAYRGSYRKRIKLGLIKNKKLRPVNLKLSGKFLRSLIANTIKIAGSWFPVIEFNDSESDKKEEGHRKGANKQAKRPIIPKGRESFKTDIIRRVERIYALRFDQVLKRIFR